MNRADPLGFSPTDTDGSDADPLIREYTDGTLDWMQRVRHVAPTLHSAIEGLNGGIDATAGMAAAGLTGFGEGSGGVGGIGGRGGDHGSGAFGEGGSDGPTGLGNPFRGKSPDEIDQMFRDGGFDPRGPDPGNGFGGYVNPKTGRSYHIDPANSYGEGPHVDVNRPRDYRGPLDKKKYPM